MRSFKNLAPLIQSCQSTIRNVTNRAAIELVKVPKVQISPGKIRYLQIKIYIHGKTLFKRTIIRGWDAPRHDPIFAKISSELSKFGICSEGLGGGVIESDAENRKIKIYGKCKSFGRANHYKTRDILSSLPDFKDYKFEIEH